MCHKAGKEDAWQCKEHLRTAMTQRVYLRGPAYVWSDTGRRPGRLYLWECGREFQLGGKLKSLEYSLAHFTVHIC